MAKAVADYGLAVFPARDKKPLVAWKELATTDLATLQGWWDKWPDAEVGVPMPPGSVAVDIDDMEAARAAEAAGYLWFRSTLGQQTRNGGFHFFYKTDGNPVPQVVKRGGIAIDTRVGGKGYVIAYDSDAFDTDKWAMAPDWVYEGAPDAQTSAPKADNAPMGTRSDILSWLGTFPARGIAVSEKGYLALLRTKLEEGGIVSLDPKRPWTTGDFKVLAAEAAKWEVGSGPVPGPALNAPQEPVEPRQPAQAVLVSSLDRSLPPPLLLDRLDPRESTVLFGPGGVGKGSLACSWIARLVADGRRVLILDYESHDGEWARRLGGLGADLDGILYLAPLKERMGSLWHGIEDIATIIRDGEVDYVVIDSAVAACHGSDVLKPETAALYMSAVQQLGVPSLTLAHVTKLHDARYPFGSVFWHNFTRVTWSLMEKGEDILLSCRKVNNYRRPGAQTVEMTWYEDTLREVTERPAGLTLLDRIEDVLDTGETLTPKDIAGVLNDGYEASEHTSADSIRKILSRQLRTPDSPVTKVGDGWVLRKYVAPLKPSLARAVKARWAWRHPHRVPMATPLACFVKERRT